jgi:lysozyme family protein
MATIAPALEVVLKHEVDPVKGPYSNDPNDRGGPTCYGITIAVYRGFKPGATVEDLKNIPMAEVEMIYKANYWQPLVLDEIVDQVVATKIFDFGVNAGIGAASARAQRACRACGKTDIKVDGWIGPVSRKAINEIPSKDFLAAFKEQQRDHYLDIVRHNTTQLTFLYTWIRRAEWPLIGDIS